MTIDQAIEFLRGLDAGARGPRWVTYDCKDGAGCWCAGVRQDPDGDRDVFPPGMLSRGDALHIAHVRNVLPQLIDVVVAAQSLAEAARWSAIEENGPPLPGYVETHDALAALAVAVEKERG